jgi:CheY-like chemotaxis protein
MCGTILAATMALALSAVQPAHLHPLGDPGPSRSLQDSGADSSQRSVTQATWVWSLVAGGAAFGALLGAYWGVRRRLSRARRELAEKAQESREALIVSQELRARLGQFERAAAVKVWVADVAHSFNNFLTNIIGSTELLRMQDGQGTYADLTASILDSGNQASGLCRHLQQAVGGKVIKREPHDLLKVVRELLPSLSESVAGDLEIQLASDCAPAVAHVDRNQFSQTLLSLVLHIQGMRASAIVIRSLVVGKKDGEHPTAVLEFVAAGAELFPGAAIGEVDPVSMGGLPNAGLSMAMLLAGVRRHGGRVIASKTEDGRSCLAIHVPAAVAGGQAVTVPRSPAVAGESAATSGERVSATVVIVDDEQIVRVSLKSMLARLDVVAADFASGLEALAFVQGLPDGHGCVALVDLTMPGMDGVELVRQLQKIDRPIECVLMSGHTSEEISECAGELGLDLFLTKPFALDEVEHLLRGLPENMQVV